MIKKETLALGNTILVGNKVGKILELANEHATVIYDDGTVDPKTDYGAMDGLLVTDEFLSKTHYEARSVNLSGELIQDWIKNVIVSQEIMYTVSLKKLTNGCWEMKIEDKDYVVISTTTVYFVHNLENIISTVITAHLEHH